MTKSKTTRIRLRTRSIAAAAVLALGAGAAVPAIAAASGAASTQVTSTPENDGFTGLVKSPQLKQCAKNRKVIVLKQLGSTQNPRSDQRVLTTTADDRQGDAYMWDTGNSGHMNGKFYAHVNRTASCQAASSPSARMLPNN
jgi:ABC-type sugar transport system substrate-binding protein